MESIILLSMVDTLLNTLNKYNVNDNISKNTQILKSFPKFKQIKQTDSLLLKKECCPICSKLYKNQEYKRTLKGCKHTFHKKCIDKWLIQGYHYNHMECPICCYNYK
jgi:hypothetical protein